MDLKNKFVKYLNKFNNLIQIGGKWQKGNKVRDTRDNLVGELDRIEGATEDGYNIWIVKINGQDFEIPQNELEPIDEDQESFHSLPSSIKQ
jgi:hypothetical protein